MTCAEFLKSLTTHGAPVDQTHAEACPRCAEAFADFRVTQRAAGLGVAEPRANARTALNEARRRARTTRAVRGLAAATVVLAIALLPLPVSRRIGTQVRVTPTEPGAALLARTAEVRSFVADRARHYALVVPTSGEIQLSCYGCGEFETARLVGALQDRFPELRGPAHVSALTEKRADSLARGAQAFLENRPGACPDCPESLDIGGTKVALAALGSRPEVVAFRLATRTGTPLNFATPPIDPEEESAPYTPGATRSVQAPEIGSAPPVLGDLGAPVRILVFADLANETSIDFESTLRTVVADYHGAVALELRYLPTPGNKDSEDAARAALAAAEQGRFWALHDRLVARHGAVSRQLILQDADAAGLDIAGVEAALDDAKVPQALARDRADADALGVSAAPTIFVNGVRIDGPRGPAFVRKAVAVEMSYANLLQRPSNDPEAQALPFLVSGLFDADTAPCLAADALRRAVALAPPCSRVRDGAQRELAALVQVR